MTCLPAKNHVTADGTGNVGEDEFGEVLPVVLRGFGISRSCRSVRRAPAPSSKGGIVEEALARGYSSASRSEWVRGLSAPVESGPTPTG